jgi:probable HAF family extracellular repeat protein
MCITATTLFAALAVPVRLATQDKQHGGPKHHHYKFIDIGTLGGPHSYFSADGLGAQILTHQGTIAGYGDTPFPDPYAPNCVDVDCYLAHAFRWQHGEKTDLGSLPGTNGSAVSVINGRGSIAGFSQNGQIDPLTGSPEAEAVLWKSNEIVPLGTLGGNESLAIGLNDHSQVVGVAANSVPDNFSMFGWGVQSRAFLWEKGLLQDLGTLGGPDAGPGPGIGNPNIFGTICINDRGQVAGASYTNSTPDPVLLAPTTDPFLWEKGTGMQDLGTLGGTLGVVNSLNNRGHVAGQSNLVGNLSAHAFLWDKRHGMTDLGTLGGSYSAPNWINDSGQVVGQANTQNDQAFHSTLWKDDKITDLGTVDGDCSSAALAVNSEGQIVGWSFACDFSTARAYIWENGSMIDLSGCA